VSAVSGKNEARRTWRGARRGCLSAVHDNGRTRYFSAVLNKELAFRGAELLWVEKEVEEENCMANSGEGGDTLGVGCGGNLGYRKRCFQVQGKGAKGVGCGTRKVHATCTSV